MICLSALVLPWLNPPREIASDLGFRLRQSAAVAVRDCGGKLAILIHLLNRRKYREMRWAAMRFLVAALQKNQRRVKVEQWLLLAARTLVILLAVAAMAKPFLESLGAVVLPGQRTHRVIVLDGSMSMAFVAGDQPRFEQAKALADQLVRDARRGDVLSVVLMGEPPRVVVGDASPSANGSEVVKEIDARSAAPTARPTWSPVSRRSTGSSASRRSRARR